MLHHFRPVLICLLLCGFYYKFYKGQHPRLQLITRIYCVFLAALVIYSTIYCCDPENISQIWSLSEYVASVIVILVCNPKLRPCFKKMSYIDTCLRVNHKTYKHTNIKIYCFIILVWMIRIVYTTVYCFFATCYKDVPLYLVSQFSLMAMDLIRVWRFIVFDMIRFRIKLLRVRMEELPESNSYFYVNKQKTLKKNKMKFCLHLYRQIADTLDLCSPELFASMFVSIVCSLPKLIINVYNILLVVEEHEENLAILFIGVHLFQICLFLFTPCLVMELLSIEVENIRIYLINKYVDETDERVKEDVILFLRYTEIRNFQYKIWRVIPFNLSLPLEIISLCTTYVIVLINFTHLY